MGLHKRILLVLAVSFILIFIFLEYPLYLAAKKQAINNVYTNGEVIHNLVLAFRSTYQQQFISSGLSLNEKTIGFLPAASLTTISKQFSNLNKGGVSFDTVSDRPRNINHMANQEEIEAMNFFRKNSKETRYFKRIDNKHSSYYLYATPLWIEKRCLVCHGKREDAPLSIREAYGPGQNSAYNYKLGDLRGLLSVRVPVDTLEDQAWNLFVKAMWGNLFLFLLLFLVIAFVIKSYLARPFSRLIKGMDEISSGHYSQEMEVFDGEFGLVSSSFNQMSKNLENTTSSLVKAKKEAEKAAIFKSKFLSSISHDIRTPLNIIQGLTSTLLGIKGRQRNIDTSDSDHEDEVKYLGLIKQASKYILAVSNDVLELGRLQSGEILVSNKKYKIKEMIESTVALFRVETERKGVFLGLHFDENLPEDTYGDPRYLERILFNIIGNAVKFTSHGNIQVSAELSCGNILIHVIDTGIGISKDFHESVFEEFVQADKEGLNKFQGTGLGLSISKRLIQLMGGTISLDSEPGQGTSITIGLPFDDLNKSDSNGRTTEKTMNVAPTNNLPKNILVVDDVDENRMLIELFLENLPVKIEYAINGREAINKVCRADSLYDVVFMDLQMPVIDGYRATRLIRAWETQNSKEPVYIIALSASVLDDDRNKAIDSGCDAYIGKPFEKEILLSYIYRDQDKS